MKFLIHIWLWGSLPILIIKNWQAIEQPLQALILLGVIPGTNIELGFNIIAPISLAILGICFWILRRLDHRKTALASFNQLDLIAL